MSKAIRFHQTGGPEVLRWEEVEVGAPGPGEARVRQHAVGLNFIDTYHRSGLYPVPLPSGLGLEAAGVVEAVGPGVRELAPGDRVAYAGGPLGAYAEKRLMPAERLVKLPDPISFEQAAAMMLAGMTAQYLVRRAYPVRPGDKVLVHAAAGGVGLIACQWAKALGAIVIGTVSSEAKAALARAHGCDHAILYTAEDFVARVRELTAGRGVQVVYDGVGRDTFLPSLDCLALRGTSSTWCSAAPSGSRSTSATRWPTPPGPTATSPTARPPARPCSCPRSGGARRRRPLPSRRSRFSLAIAPAGRHSFADPRVNLALSASTTRGGYPWQP